MASRQGCALDVALLRHYEGLKSPRACDVSCGRTRLSPYLERSDGLILIARVVRARLAQTSPSPGRATASLPLFSTDDAVMGGLLIHLRSIANGKAPAAWPDEALKASRDLHRHFEGLVRPSFSSRIPGVLAELSGLEPRELSIRLFAAYLLEKIEVLAVSRGKYEPSGLRLEGESFIRVALSQGRGAVRWWENSSYARRLQKAAMAQAGFGLHHLSRAGHNLSSTRFGLRYLNPIVQGAENRYLAERIVVGDGSEVAASRRIMAVLKANEIVSVTVNSAGARVVEAPMLEGVLRVATGAPHFALASGAPLLPVICHREGSEYVVEIGAPIALSGLTREAAYAFAVEELARRIEAYVRRHPLDWSGWLRGAYVGGEVTSTSGGPRARRRETPSPG